MDTIEIAEHAYPDLARRITSLVNALLAQRRPWAGRMPRSRLFTVISRCRNFLISGEHVALIDMDSLCLGDPLTDIGSLIANFHLNGIRAGSDMGRIRTIVDVFVLRLC